MEDPAVTGGRAPSHLEFVRESTPRWDADKERILGAAAPGIFPIEGYRSLEVLPGEWWCARQAGKVRGYGWMDVTWGFAPVLLAVDPESAGRGVGSAILEHLAEQARRRGLAYMFNVIPDAHPDPAGLSAWLQRHGFAPAVDDRSLQRRL